MSTVQPFAPQVGAVLSADIAVPDHADEVRFYAHVLGTGEAPLWRDDLMNNLGLPIIGLGEPTPETAHLPLQWMPHIQVSSVAASVKRALELGGSELMHYRDDAGESQWAVLLDPSGAAFGLIPVVPADAMPPAAGSTTGDDAPPVGRIAWLDLTVPDADTLRDFYREVVGWSIHEVEMTDEGEAYADYAMLAEDGSPAGGVCHARGKNLGMPPVWLLYLTVGDLAESVRRVPEEGGSVVKGVLGKDGELMYAAIRDPVGAFVALMQG
ncbi:VOC family protein [soil metagenome]